MNSTSSAHDHLQVSILIIAHGSPSHNCLHLTEMQCRVIAFMVLSIVQASKNNNYVDILQRNVPTATQVQSYITNGLFPRGPKRPLSSDVIEDRRAKG